ncbi:serine carboxypeptidase domain-containing protein [Ditylenchus destructor]|nr:serine carboxypeptidase domain-containing protein [Ditylenchus destructor]
MSWAYSLIFLSLLCILSNAEDIKDTKDKDEVKWQPGVTFAYTSKQYSGYLRLSSKNNLHYWLLESQSAEPSKDPLFLWVPGGPGCSAISGLASIGPFLFNPDGTTVFENVYAWNKLGNILFLDTVIGPGYSYTETIPERNPILNDDKVHTSKLPFSYHESPFQTVADLIEALKKFIDRFPEYVNREFHILGESYAGVTIPLLATKIIDMNSKDVKELKLNLKNIAIGNGFFSVSHNVNAHVNLAYFRGIIGTEDYTFFQSKCCATVDILPNCNFSKYVKYDYTQHVYVPILNDNADNNLCANKVADLANTMSKPIPGYNNMDPLLDCYTNDFKPVGVTGDNAQTEFLRIVAYRQAQANAKQTVPIIHDGLNRFVDQASLLNLQSTDQFGGYRCYSNKAVKAYFNRDDLRRSLKIPSVFDKTTIDICPTGDQKWTYEMQYLETAQLFKSIIDSKYPLGILIFNGDTDGDCSFLMASTFVRSLPLDQIMDGNRTFWQFQKDNYLPMTVGYYERFQKNSVTLDLLTISGAPHRVETSHPGPALQMIANMLTPERNYSKPLSSNPTSNPKSLKSPLKAPPIVSRKQADLITDLPGLTFDAKFKQYSGYLAASTKNYLHYWLNGGPGCSSLFGLLAENGPVHINPDLKTLFENVYSWNRFSNILYLETPHGVGFSYHDTTDSNPDPGYGDTKTLTDTYLALVDFFSVYPEYQTRDFYIMGESYGGVYAPSLADDIIKKIQAKTIHASMKDVNFVGLAIGNGLLSLTHQINSIIAMKYHRGFIGKEQWDFLKRECFQEVTKYQDMVRANFSRYIQLEDSSYSNIIPIDNSPCAIANSGNCNSGH